MKERPILFSGPMVRAILEGRKTQTRRVVRPQPSAAQIKESTIGKTFALERGFGGVRCPYGLPGDRLWVRETWQELLWQHPTKPPGVASHSTIAYRASGESDVPIKKWRTPIFMPRWASRISLEIAAVRVERLREISEVDARAEGMETLDVGVSSLNGEPAQGVVIDPRLKYAAYWDSLHAKGDGFLFASNPWVWVIEFRR